MEKLFLCGLLAADKLYIVDEKNVYIAVLFPEQRIRLGIAIPDGVDDLIGEVLTGDIKNLLFRIGSENKVSDGLHQVCLAETYAAVDIQGIVDLCGTFRHCQGCRMGKIVVVAHNEVGKGVLGIQTGLLKYILLLRRFRHRSFVVRCIIIGKNKANIKVLSGDLRDRYLQGKVIFLLNIIESDGFLRHHKNDGVTIYSGNFDGKNPGFKRDVGYFIFIFQKKKNIRPFLPDHIQVLLVILFVLHK